MIQISQRQKLLLGVFLLFASLLSTVVAATVTINTDNRVEFGQGLYRVGACDSFVKIEANYDQNEKINELIINGLDIRRCPEVYLRIKIFGSGTTPLNLYEESDTAVNRVMLYFNGDPDRFEGVDFFNVIGQIPQYESCLDENGNRDLLRFDCKTDDNIEFDFFNGIYTIKFLTPMATKSGAQLFTVETSSFQFDEIRECDVSPNITKEATPGVKLGAVIIDNLDVQNCIGKYIRIRFFESGTTPPSLGLYRDSYSSLVDGIYLYIDDEPDFLQRLKFLHSDRITVENYGACPVDQLDPYCKQDDYLRLSYFNGTYTVKFLDPEANFNEALNYLVESASDVDELD